MSLSEIYPLVLYGLAVVVIFLTLVAKIEIGIYYLFFLLPQRSAIDSLIDVPLGKDIMDVLLLTVCLKWFFNSTTADGPVWQKTPLNAPIFFLIIWCFFELFVGSAKFDLPLPIQPSDPRLQAFKNLVYMYMLFFVVINNVRSRTEIKRLIYVIAISIIMAALKYYWDTEIARSVNYFDWNLIHASGTFSILNKNSIGAFFAIYAILFTALLLMDNQFSRKLLYGVVLIPAFLSLLYTFARGAYLAMLLGFLCLGVLRYRIILLLLIAFLPLWEYVVPIQVYHRINMTFGQEEGLDNSAESRFDFWKQSLTRSAESPIIGFGYITAPVIGFRSKLARGLGEGGKARSPHNGYLLELLELGIIGLILVVYPFVYGLIAGWKLYRSKEDGLSRGLGLGLVLATVVILILNMLGTSWREMLVIGYYWAFLALAMTLRQAESESPAKEKPAVETVGYTKRVLLNS